MHAYSFHFAAGNINVIKKGMRTWNDFAISGNVSQVKLICRSCSCYEVVLYFVLQNDTEVKVVYAYHTSSDANAGLPKHSVTGILSGKHNLISMAMLAMQPSATTATMQPSSTTATMQPSSTTEAMQPSSTAAAMQLSSGIHASATVMRPTASMDSGRSTAKPPSYASLVSPDGFFKLQWTYSNSKLLFKMTCKTTGWCAVGFTKTADGMNMVNYDIAVAGYASGAGYVDVSKLSCFFFFIFE